MKFKDFIADENAYMEYSWFQSVNGCLNNAGAPTLRVLAYSPVTNTSTSFIWEPCAGMGRGGGWLWECG